VLFSEIWPVDLVSTTSRSRKSDLGDLIWKCYKFAAMTDVTMPTCSEIGFREATKSGVSIVLTT